MTRCFPQGASRLFFDPQVWRLNNPTPGELCYDRAQNFDLIFGGIRHA